MRGGEVGGWSGMEWVFTDRYELGNGYCPWQSGGTHLHKKRYLGRDVTMVEDGLCQLHYGIQCPSGRVIN